MTKLEQWALAEGYDPEWINAEEWTETEEIGGSLFTVALYAWDGISVLPGANNEWLPAWTDTREWEDDEAPAFTFTVNADPYGIYYQFTGEHWHSGAKMVDDSWSSDSDSARDMTDYLAATAHEVNEMLAAFTVPESAQ